MGGGYYNEDVSPERDETTNRHFNYSGGSEQPERREVHEDLNIKGKKREARNSAEHPNVTPIVVAMDVTRSRGDDAKVIYQKLPMLMGQLYMKGYVSDPTICFAAIGDATSGDKAPIQVGQFEADERLDQMLGNIWLEEGGGGTGQESYELMAYALAKKSVLDINQHGGKGYFFFIGDEGFYPFVDKGQVKVFVGDDIPANIDSAKIFAELQQKYNVFFIYPRKSWQQRKGDIDAEIQQRVERAGGQYKDVDIRASLLWNNRNDLDLHMITPDGEEIYYGHKRSDDGKGWLDVDMNVHGETTKPVENIRYAKGDGKPGKYRVFVRNYGFHESSRDATPFRVEIEINGEIQHFTGETKARLDGPGSDVEILTFEYDPSKRKVTASDEVAYSNYDDAKIKAQWASVLPAENILIIDDPKAIIDVMMGALAITAGTNIEQYLIDMGERGQDTKRIRATAESLANLSTTTSVAKIDTIGLPKVEGKKRKSNTTRL